MVLDFITVSAFFLLCAYKLGLIFLSVPASVVPSLKIFAPFQQPANKSKHSDLVKLSLFLFQKNRQLHQADVWGVITYEY